MASSTHNWGQLKRVQKQLEEAGFKVRRTTDQHLFIMCPKTKRTASYSVSTSGTKNRANFQAQLRRIGAGHIKL